MWHPTSCASGIGRPATSKRFTQRRGLPIQSGLISYINRLLDGWRTLYQPGGYRQRDTERGSLSSREREIVDLIAQGQSNKAIAKTLGIGDETVKSHVKNIFIKLGVDTRA